MQRIGLLVLCLCFAAPAGGEGVSLKYFGEDPDQEYTPTPDQSDATENWARHGDHAGGTTPKGPAEEAPAPAPEEDVEVPPVQWPADKPPAYGEDRDVVPVPRAWPGPRRPARATALRNPAARAGARPDVVGDDEVLRDAPAAVPAAHYSLWKNLSTPLMLPAGQVAGAGAGAAKELGRRDYERTILGLRGKAGAVAAAPAGRALPELPEKGIYVAVEMKVEDFDAHYAARAAAFARATGFELDRAAPPERRAGRVVFRGWLSPKAMGRAGAAEHVARITSLTGRRRPMPGGAMSDILVGLRIPPEATPTAVLREAARRLARDADFELERAVGYQRIPGTSRMVLVVSGRVPVRRIGKLMADPAVVKTVPAPKAGRPPIRRAAAGPEGLFARFKRFHDGNRVIVVLVLVLVTFSMLSTSFGSRRRRYSR